MNQNYNNEFQNNVNNGTNVEIGNTQLTNDNQYNNYNNINQQSLNIGSNNLSNNNPKKNSKLLIVILLIVICLIVVGVILLLNKQKNDNGVDNNNNQTIESNNNNSIPVAMPETWDWNVWNNSLKYISSNTKNLSEDYTKFTFNGNVYSLYTLQDFINKELEVSYTNKEKTEYHVKYYHREAGIFSFNYSYSEGIEALNRPAKLYMQVSFDGSWRYGKETLDTSCTKCFKENDDWFNIFNSLYLNNGVTIGQTESEVIKILGTPSESYVGDDEGDIHDTFVIYQDENVIINNKCDFDKGRLTIITITINITNITSNK